MPVASQTAARGHAADVDFLHVDAVFPQTPVDALASGMVIA
jgi:hypothetical protein